MAPARAADIGLADPQTAWADLAASDDALLIDVRTKAEWTFVGAPDLSRAAARLALIEWSRFPTMAPNPDFLADASAAVTETGAARVYFICRSGARSAAAAQALQAHLAGAARPVACFNVIEGFEGDLDPSGRRGVVAGWKARGLPWRQT